MYIIYSGDHSYPPIILDDFIFIGPANLRITSLSLEAFLLFCNDCGILIKTSKTVLPSTCTITHGIKVDTRAMEARLPADKNQKVPPATEFLYDKTRSHSERTSVFHGLT